MRELGKRLKEERIKSGFKTKEVAARLGVSANTVRAYERIGGETQSPKPSYDNLVKLAIMYDVSLDYLCFGEKCGRMHDIETVLWALLDMKGFKIKVKKTSDPIINEFCRVASILPVDIPPETESAILDALVMRFTEEWRCERKVKC